MFLPVTLPLFRCHIFTGGLHLVVEPGDAGKDIRRLFRARRGCFVKLPPRVGPAAHLDDALFSEEGIIATVGIGMDIASIILKIIKRSFLAAINGKVVGRKRRISFSPHIDPKPRLFEFSIALYLQGDGRVVGKNNVAFENGSSEGFLQGLDTLV